MTEPEKRRSGERRFFLAHILQEWYTITHRRPVRAGVIGIKEETCRGKIARRVGGEV